MSKYIYSILFLFVYQSSSAQNIQFKPFGSICAYKDTLVLDSFVNLNKGKWELIDIDGNGPGSARYIAANANMVDSTKIKLGIAGSYYWRYSNPNNGNPLLDSTYMTINTVPVVILTDETRCQDAGSFRVNQILLRAPQNPDAGVHTWSIDSAPAGLTQIDLNQILEDRNPSPFLQDYWFNPNTLNINPQLPPRGAGCYKLKFCYTDGVTQCTTCDITKVCITELSKIVFKPFDKFCYSNDTIKLDSYVNLKNGRWELRSFNGKQSGADFNFALNRIIDSTKINVIDTPGGRGGTYYWRYVNVATGCLSKDSVIMNVSPRLQLSVTDLDTICFNGSNIDLTKLVSTPNPFTFKAGGPLTGWTGQGVLNDSFFPSKITSPSTDLYIGPYVLNAVYQHPNTTCINKDSIDLIIENKLNYKTQVFVVHNTLTAVQENVKYQWMDCDNGLPIPGANQRSYTATRDGNYRVILSHGNCNQSDTSNCIAFSKVGLNKLKSNAIEIFPNPVNNSFTLKLSNSGIHIQSITIYDVLGRTRAFSYSKSNQINNTLPAGVYLIKIQTNQGRVIKKLIKE